MAERIVAELAAWLLCFPPTCVLWVILAFGAGAIGAILLSMLTERG